VSDFAGVSGEFGRDSRATCPPVVWTTVARPFSRRSTAKPTAKFASTTSTRASLDTG
jgi:hypothetical protein